MSAKTRYIITSGTQYIPISVTTVEGSTILIQEPMYASNNVFTIAADYYVDEIAPFKFEIKPMMSPAERRLIKMERKIQL
jgi:hypothetical protein